MQQLILVLVAVAAAVMVAGMLIPLLVGRPETPEDREQRDRELRDELHVLG